MSDDRPAPPGASERLRSDLQPLFLPLALLSLAALLAACGRVPSAPIAGPDPSDPQAVSRPLGYQSPLGQYERRRPVEPSPWRERMDRVAPPARR
jgi:hypothetical protein